MSSLLARLKANKGKNTSALKERLEQQGQGGFKADPRIWKYSWTETAVAGEFLSVNEIRFLPTPMIDMQNREEGKIPEDAVLTPCALIISHWFEGTNGTYKENSLATFDEVCPVRVHDQPLWKHQKATEDEGLKKILKKRLPATDYYANILVINDGTKPENNGKVMLFKFGRAIKKIIDGASAPKFPTDPKIEDVFCAWEGANMNLNLTGVKTKNGRFEFIKPDFAKAEWAHPTPLAETDEAIEEIWGKCHSLQDFYDRKNFKPYEQLEKRFKVVMGIPEDANLGDQMAVDSTVSAAPTDSQQAGPTTVETETDTPVVAEQKQETVTEVKTEVKQEPVADNLTEFERMLQEAKA